MATLTKDTPQVYGEGPTVDARLIAGAAVKVGSILQGHTSAASPYSAGVADFMGIALDSATAAGGRIAARVVGNWIGAIADTVNTFDEGAAVYALAGSDNPADITKTAGSNLPIGRIALVHTAGATGANKVEIHFEADGYRSL